MKPIITKHGLDFHLCFGVLIHICIWDFSWMSKSCTLLVCSNAVNKGLELSKLYLTLIGRVKGLSLPPEAHVWANIDMSYSLGQNLWAMQIAAQLLYYLWLSGNGWTLVGLNNKDILLDQGQCEGVLGCYFVAINNLTFTFVCFMNLNIWFSVIYST